MTGKGRPPQAIPSPISKHIITCYVRYQGSKHTVIYIYIYIYPRTNYHKCPSQTRGRQEETHCVHLTGFGAYSSTCCKGTDNCAGTMGVDQLPSSTVWIMARLGVLWGFFLIDAQMFQPITRSIHSLNRSVAHIPKCTSPISHNAYPTLL